MPTSVVNRFIVIRLTLNGIFCCARISITADSLIGVFSVAKNCLSFACSYGLRLILEAEFEYFMLV